MKKRKLVKRVVVWAVLLLALTAFVVFVGIPLFRDPDHSRDTPVVIYGYDESGEAYALENDALRFELDPATTRFTVTDKKSGQVWYSSPKDAEADPIALPVEKNKLQSSLTMTYSTNAGTKTLFTANEHSVTNGVYEVKREENAVRVNYTFGRISRQFTIPQGITEERMTLYLDKLDSKAKKQMKEYYRLVDIKKLRKTDNKEQLLETYPDLAQQKVYVLRDNTADYLKLRIEDYLASAGYTKEDYAADMARCNIPQATATAVFNASVRYYLDGGDLMVEVPLDSIAYYADYPMTTLNILPSFGAGGPDDKGYLLVPDGSGALINFNSGKLHNPYYANLYGWDWASFRRQVTSETRAGFPVFGVASGSGSFICAIEEGAAYAGVSADVAGRYTSYNTVGANYTIVHGDAYDVSDRTNDAVYMFEKQVPQGRILQRYRFLQSADYADMARAYGDYLQNKYPNELTLKSDASTPVAVELVGAIDRMEQRFGVPTRVAVPMTTFAQAKELVQTLLDKGMTNLSVKYAGWINGGVNQKILNSVNLVSELGTADELRGFIAYAKEKGVDVYLDGLTQFTRSSGLLEGFVYVRDAACYTTREEVFQYPYNPIWYGPEDWKEGSYLLKPALSAKLAQNLANAALSYGASGVSLRDTGNMLSADYDPRDLVTREESMRMQQQTLRDMRNQGLKVITLSGSDYALPLSDMVLGLDFDGGNYSIIDAYVPFLPMAIHGLVNYTGEALNNAGDYEDLLLRSAEMGAGLYFSFFKNAAKELQDTYYYEYFGADVSLSLDKAVQAYTQYNQALGHTFGQRMTAHKREGDVAVTTYEDGTRVYVNYGYTDSTADGATVPARSYLAKGGEQ